MTVSLQIFLQLCLFIIKTLKHQKSCDLVMWVACYGDFVVKTKGSRCKQLDIFADTGNIQAQVLSAATSGN